MPVFPYSHSEPGNTLACHFALMARFLSCYSKILTHHITVLSLLAPDATKLHQPLETAHISYLAPLETSEVGSMGQKTKAKARWIPPGCHGGKANPHSVPLLQADLLICLLPSPKPEVAWLLPLQSLQLQKLQDPRWGWRSIWKGWLYCP